MQFCLNIGPDPENEPPNQGSAYSPSPDSSAYAHQYDGHRLEDGTVRRKLKLVLDPRQLQDAMKLRNSGLYNEHNVISPDICFDLVKDLNSPTGKGAALFAKRKKKSEKWIVDETTVKQHEQQITSTTETTSDYGSHYPSAAATEKLIHQRVKLIKSPWEAALESPIGSCDAAFQEIRPDLSATLVANTVIKRAEDVSAQAPPPSLPTIVLPDQIPPTPTSNYLRPFNSTDSWRTSSPLANDVSSQKSTTPTYTKYTSQTTDIYKSRTPRGWGGSSSTGKYSLLISF